MSEAARRLALALEESTKLLRAIAGGTRTTRALTQALANDEALTAYRTSDGGDGEVEDLQRKLGGVGREAVKWEAKYYEALALLSRLEWSASTGWTGLACCPLCSQKMDDGHLPDCPFTGSDASGRRDMIHDDESLRVLVRTLCNDAGSVAEWARRNGLVDEQVGLFLRGARPAEPRILAALGMTKRVTYSAAHGHLGDCGFAVLTGQPSAGEP